MKFFFYLILWNVATTSLFAQGIPIGNWESFFSYNSTNTVAIDEDKIYSGKYGLQCYNKNTNEYNQYTKINGLNDINITKLAFNKSTASLIICYQNSNVDIYQNGIFYNVPDLKNANIIASKKINNLDCIGDNAYLSTGLGIVVIDIKKHEIKATYPMVINGEQAIVYDVALHQDTIVAITSKGVFVADVNNNFLQNIETWRLVNTSIFKTIAIQNDDFFMSNDSVLYRWNGIGAIQKIMESTQFITDIFPTSDTLYVSTFLNDGSLIKMNRNGLVYDTTYGVTPLQIAMDKQKVIWLANTYGGLSSLEGGIRKNYKLGGPFSNDAFNIRFINGSLYICSGYVNAQYIFGYNRGGMNRLKNNEWGTINQYNYYPQMDSIVDILDAEEDRITGSIYLASYGGGFIEIDAKGKFTQLARNSVIGSSANGNYAWLVTNLKMDAENNLWVTVSNADNNLMCRKKDGTWKGFSIPNVGDTKVMAQIEIDNIGQKWIVMPRNRGLMVFNDNNTIDNSSDDKYNTYTKAPGKGNLSSNNVRCIAKDKDGKIWVGTDNGISIINCPEQALVPGNCDAENKIVQYDIAAGKLFQDEYITTIAVDGANRKWIGTYNGAWLISADAEKILGRFTIDNSPLPSNEITKIEIDGVLGKVYFATANGVVAYRYTATDGATELLEPLVFPNPVESSYSGIIAISGLVDNADVRIIDVAGQLVYRTKALGGQAVWNGKTYTGYRPQTGIYYVLATSADGSLTQKTKFIFTH